MIKDQTHIHVVVLSLVFNRLYSYICLNFLYQSKKHIYHYDRCDKMNKNQKVNSFDLQISTKLILNNVCNGINILHKITHVAGQVNVVFSGVLVLTCCQAIVKSPFSFSVLWISFSKQSTLLGETQNVIYYEHTQYISYLHITRMKLKIDRKRQINCLIENDCVIANGVLCSLVAYHVSDWCICYWWKYMKMWEFNVVGIYLLQTFVQGIFDFQTILWKST